jgi:hypothetical protein
MKSATRTETTVREGQSTGSRERILTVVELACCVRATPRTIQRLVEFELIQPCACDPEPLFATDVLPKVRRIMRLHRHVGVSFPSMGLVLDLLDQLAAMEDLLARLQAARKEREENGS